MPSEIVNACDFGYDGTTTDSTSAVAALQAAVDAWIANVESTFASDVTGGCEPLITGNDWDGSYPDICGGTITITWTVEDLCETTTITASYEVTPPPAIVLPTVPSEVVNACDFGYDGTTTDSTSAVAALQAAVDAWIANVESTFASDVTGGCEPLITGNDWDGSYPDICGGTITITWTVEDLCETTTITASYEVTPPPAIVLPTVPSEIVNACDFGYDGTTTDSTSAVAALQAAVDAWIANVESTFASDVTGGCEPLITGNDWDGSYPDICGGTITITWTVEDLCETTTITASYEVTPPPAIVLPTVPSEVVNACDFGYDGTTTDSTSAVAALQAAVDAWIANVESTFASDVTGGCEPLITGNDWDGSYPDICGGTITITWTVEDLCETTTITASYEVTPPPAIVLPTVPSEVVNACDFGYDGTTDRQHIRSGCPSGRCRRLDC